MTTTTAMTLLGATAGLGIVLVAVALVGRRPTLEQELARLDPYSTGGATPPAGAAGGLNGLFTQLGQPLAGVLARLSGGSGRLDADLAVIGRGRAEHSAAVGTATVAGAACLPALVALADLAGLRVPLLAPLLACLAMALLCALLPSLAVRRRAQQGRLQFRQALASWLELVALAQAAGMGLESALQSASGICDDASFRRIRRAVDVSRSTGVPPWVALRRLGGELGIADLEELGSNLALAGSEGARIRSSLAAKAASLRRRELAEAEAEANAMTERLFLPSVVLMFGFLLFVGYPALVTVTRVL
jgi:tight adherence protein C